MLLLLIYCMRLQRTRLLVLQNPSESSVRKLHGIQFSMEKNYLIHLKTRIENITELNVLEKDFINFTIQIII